MRRKLYLFIVLGVLLLLTSCTRSVNLTFYNEGQSKLSNNQFSEALVDFKKSINANPTHSESYVAAAQVLILKKNYSDAIELLNNGAIYVDKKDDIYSKIGEAQYLNKSYDEAVNSFKTALNFNPNHQTALEGLLNTYAVLEKFDQVNNIVESRFNTEDSVNVELVKVFVSVLEQEKALGKLEKLKDKLSEADLSELKTTIENSKDKDLITKNMLLARVIINYGYPQFALPLVTPVIEQNEYYEGGHLFKGIIYFLIDKLDASEQLLTRASQLNSSYGETYRYLAKVKVALGKNEDAEKFFVLAEQKSETKVDIYKDEIDFYKDELNFVKAAEKVKSLLEVEMNIQNQFTLGEIYCLDDDKKTELEQLITEMGSIPSESNNIQLILDACINFKNGDYQSSEDKLNTALNSDTKLLLGHVLLLKIYKIQNLDDKFNAKMDEIIDKDLDGFYTKIAESLSI